MTKPTNNVRKLTKTGRSQSMVVVIPAEYIRSLGWRKKQRVLVQKVARGILIRDAMFKKRKK